LLIPRYVFEQVGVFNEDLRYNQDFELWLRFCLEKYSWIYHNDVGVLARVHANQVTQTRRDLFYSDSYKLGEKLIPVLADISTANENFLYMYANRCGKYNLNKNVDLCVKELRIKKLCSFSNASKLKIMCLYGKIRPSIRRVYYMIFKKVKTK
jgi:hypothetical protein